MRLNIVHIIRLASALSGRPVNNILAVQAPAGVFSAIGVVAATHLPNFRNGDAWKDVDEDFAEELHRYTRNLRAAFKRESAMERWRANETGARHVRGRWKRRTVLEARALAAKMFPPQTPSTWEPKPHPLSLKIAQIRKERSGPKARKRKAAAASHAQAAE